jgi:hypothetical protein
MEQIDGAESAPRGFAAWALLILALAALLRFWALDTGLPHPRTRPDEQPVLQHTAHPARGEFDLNWSVYPSAYVYLNWAWGEAGLRVLQELGLAPVGGYLDVLRNRPEHIYLVNRALSAAAGVLAVGLLMWLARREIDGRTALVSGALLATSFLHVRDSHAIKPDVLLSLAVLLSLVAMLPLARRATPAHGALAGVGVGVAMAVKYPGVLLLVPVYAAGVMGSRARGWRRWLPLPTLFAGASAAALFLATSPFLVFDEKSVEMLAFILRVVFPWLVTEAAIADGSAATQLVVMGPPLSSYASPEWWGGLAYHARFSLRWGTGLAVTLLTLPAVFWGLSNRHALLKLAALFTAFYYVVVSMSPALLARYMTPLIPVLALLIGAMLTAIVSRLGGRHAGVLLLGLTTLVAAEPLVRAVAFDRVAARTDTRVLASQWLAVHLPPGARVAVMGTRFWSWGTPVIPPGLKRVKLVPAHSSLSEQGVDYLLTHDHELFWSSVDPGEFEPFERELRLLADIDPAHPQRRGAVFETPDAYYIPFHGFCGVIRPGPRVRIYAVEAPGTPGDRSAPHREL